MKFIKVGKTLINLDLIQTITITDASVGISFVGEGGVWLEGKDAEAFMATLGRQTSVVSATIETPKPPPLPEPDRSAYAKR